MSGFRSTMQQQGTCYTAATISRWGDTGLRGEMVKAVAQRSEPCFLGEVDPVLVLALPVNVRSTSEVVAVAAFVTRPVGETENLAEAAKLLDCKVHEATVWCRRQEVWSPRQLNALATAFLNGHWLRAENSQLRRDVDEVSSNLATTYEEISVLYEVTQNLNLLSSDEELGQLALDWLKDVIPAESLAIEYLPDTQEEHPSASRRNKPVLLTTGRELPEGVSLAQFAERFQAGSHTTAIVENHVSRRFDDWSLPEIRQIVMVPLAQGSRIYGWLSAINFLGDNGFGTVEASLMGSVAAILRHSRRQHRPLQPTV